MAEPEMPPEDDAERGRRGAEEAWHEESARLLTRDHLYPSAPILTASGLSLGMSTESRAYVNAWNLRTKELLAEHGLPSWAPAARIPATEALEALVAQAVPVADFAFPTREDRHFRRMCLRGVRANGRIARVDARTVAVVTPDGGVDLLDTVRCAWIARVEPNRPS